MLEPVPFTDVTINDRFWTPRQETNRTVTVPHCLAMLEQAGNIHNFRLAAEGKREGYKGPVYMDSDLYKTMEGIAYSLAIHPDSALEARLDEIIDLIGRAQMPDGYLNTWHQVNAPDERWTNLRDRHELYCAGHLIEAAVAHEQATGKGTLLGVALRFAEHIWQRFGPDGIAAYPGHPEIELALIKLWKLTDDQRWFELAKRFLDNRGNGYLRAEGREMKKPFDETYFVDLPVRTLTRGTGHAVRFCYLMCGAADIAAETNDPALKEMLLRCWDHVTERQMYLTGGVGSDPNTEGFGADYSLPNMGGYQETCASIAMAMWGSRMTNLFSQGRFMDVVERALHNAVASGVGLDGKSFFYENPLGDDGAHRRQQWFQCACCPPNILRTFASVGGYFFSTAPGALYIHTCVPGELSTTIDDEPFSLEIQGSYPWGPLVFITIKSHGKLAIHVRMPSWGLPASICVDGHPGAESADMKDGYLVFERHWKPGNTIKITYAMPVERQTGKKEMREVSNSFALTHGPLVYCLEQAGNVRRVSDFQVSRSPFRIIGNADLDLPGTTLYRSLGDGYEFTPYAVWANREAGPMRVWLPKR